MQIFPNDLGEKRGRAIFLKRAGQRPLPSGDDPARIGLWGRAWLGKKEGQVPVEEALPALRAIRRAAQNWSLLGLLPAGVGLALLGVTMNSSSSDGFAMLTMAGGAGGLALVCAVNRPRTLLARKLAALRDRPLRAAEVASLLPLAADELERSYLTLVLDVVREDVSAQIAPGTGADLRAALRALGEAIDKLPATRVVGGDSPDIMTEVLRRTAERTLASVPQEPDRVVAASLMRRVEALHRRADATARADVLVRRFSALRQEMAAETEALRAGLAAYYTGAHDVSDLTRLAEDVQRVAAEAAAITSAVEEVDALTAGGAVRSYGTPDAPQTRVQLGPG